MLLTHQTKERKKYQYIFMNGWCFYTLSHNVQVINTAENQSQVVLILYVVYWFVGGPKAVALTSSESEFYLRSCKRDLLFLIFFTFLGINIKLHVKVKADNLRAVYKSRQMDKDS